MPVVVIPFVFVGLFAKLANRYMKTSINTVAVHSNQDKQLYNLIAVVSAKLNSKPDGTVNIYDFFESSTKKNFISEKN